MKTKRFTILVLLSMIVMRAMAQGNVTIKEGTVDADKWTIIDGTTEVTPGTTAVAEGATVKLTYTGAKRVKSVKAIKQISPTSIAYMKWDSNQGKLVEVNTNGIVTEVGASTVNWAPGMYVVNADVIIDGDITVNGDINLIVCDGNTLTINGKIKDVTPREHVLNIYCQSEQTGTIIATNASSSVFEDLKNLNNHGVKVTAISSGENSGGVSNVKIMNVYGGSFTAENTSSGYGILLYDSDSELNIYGGVVTAEGNGSFSGIQSNENGSATVSLFYDGKLYVNSPDNKALNNVTIVKSADYDGAICESDDNTTWTLLTEDTSDKKHVKADFLTDLATLTDPEGYIVKSGETLTGILGEEVKISIPDGATVTLSGVNINGDGLWNEGEFAGINCEGNATIILEKGTTNIVRGFYEDWPGIYVPDGSTLTIKGDGTLIASPYDGGTEDSYGAGIGGGFDMDCGNIKIEGGIIFATGGTGAAGIGGAESMEGATCGDITISGGTVVATGGMYAPGIGGGNSGFCGTITIKKTVTQVTATKGEDASISIGAGEGGICDDVVIETGANVIRN